MRSARKELASELNRKIAELLISTGSQYDKSKMDAVNDAVNRLVDAVVAHPHALAVSIGHMTQGDRTKGPLIMGALSEFKGIEMTPNQALMPADIGQVIANQQQVMRDAWMELPDYIRTKLDHHTTGNHPLIVGINILKETLGESQGG